MSLIAEERRGAVLIWTLDREARLDTPDRGGSALGAYLHGYVNPDWYDGLSDKSKAALAKAGEEASGWALEASQAAAAAARRSRSASKTYRDALGAASQSAPATRPANRGVRP